MGKTDMTVAEAGKVMRRRRHYLLACLAQPDQPDHERGWDHLEQLAIATLLEHAGEDIGALPDPPTKRQRDHGERPGAAVDDMIEHSRARVPTPVLPAEVLDQRDRAALLRYRDTIAAARAMVDEGL